MVFSISLIVLLFQTLDVNLPEKPAKPSIDLPNIIRSIALIYKDDALDPEVAAFINQPLEPVWKANAYVYLWGMDKITNDPYQTGVEILKLLEQENQQFNYEKRPYDYSFAHHFTKYESPKSDLLCERYTRSCINEIINNKPQASKFISDHAHYISRYNNFLSFKHFKQIANLRMDTPLPTYIILLKAQKLYHISLLLNSDTNEERMIDSILEELTYLRIQLANIDTLLGKMLIAVLLNENIELLNYAIQTAQTLLNIDSSGISRLTPAERSIYNAMNQEHSKNLKRFIDYIEDPNRLSKKNSKPLTRKLMKLICFFVAKPNLTANTIYFDFMKLSLEHNRLSISQYYKRIKNTSGQISHDPIRNYMSWKLLTDTLPEYKEYQMRIFDIDMKLQLIRLLIDSGSIEKMTKNKNLLSSFDQTPAFIENDKVCYSGLATMSPEFRCLLIY